MRVARLFATVAAATAAGLALATPAMADGTKIPIHDTQVPTTAQDFGKDKEQWDCSGPFDEIAENKDGWHFVTPGTASFTSVTLKFGTPGGDVTVVIDGTEGAPSTGTGWKGWIDNAGAAEKHAYLITDAGWTLKEGEALVENLSEQHTFFNLSHVCPGTPDDEEEETESPTPPAGDGGSLPRTGTATGAIVIGGVALVAGGVVLLAIRRRRDMVNG